MQAVSFDYADVLDNNIMYNFPYRIREKGITVPVVALCR